MPRYHVKLSIAAYYRVEVDAADADDAKSLALTRRLAHGIKPYDFGEFVVRDVTLLSDTPRRAKYKPTRRYLRR